MRILFVWPAAEVSIRDVAAGYRSALERAGHAVADYHLGRRMAYHRKALPTEAAADMALLSRFSSENILNEALYHQADLVIVVSGLNLHPICQWLLAKVGIPVAVIFTESPYEDQQQAQWLDMSHVGVNTRATVFTNDAYSAQAYGWHHLSPSYDAAVHRPVPPSDEFRCDVVMVGTGWGERQSFLEATDWTGVDLRLYGVWPGLNSNPDSPLTPYYRPSVIDNAQVPTVYASAKICLNFHRRHPLAQSPNPRAYEIAACGAFQLSDPRPGLDIFGGAVPTFETPDELGRLVRQYLADDEARQFKAALAYKAVAPHSFDSRVADITRILQSQGVTAGDRQ